MKELVIVKTYIFHDGESCLPGCPHLIGGRSPQCALDGMHLAIQEGAYLRGLTCLAADKAVKPVEGGPFRASSDAFSDKGVGTIEVDN